MGGLRVLYGINDEDFSWKLKTDESFETPQAVISYSYQGVDKMSQNFHKVIKENIIGYKKKKSINLSFSIPGKDVIWILIQKKSYLLLMPLKNWS